MFEVGTVRAMDLLRGLIPGAIQSNERRVVDAAERLPDPRCAQGVVDPIIHRILVGRERSYNQVRAIVSKADAIAKSQTPRELKPQEVTSLVLAYSYLHAQRFGSLFDTCHRVLWQVFEERGETPPMLRLFRHSSFVWRIRGDEQKETDYLKRLSSRDVQSTPPAGASVILLELGYFLKRVKAILSSTTPQQQKTGLA